MAERADVSGPPVWPPLGAAAPVWRLRLIPAKVGEGTRVPGIRVAVPGSESWDGGAEVMTWLSCQTDWRALCS